MSRTLLLAVLLISTLNVRAGAVQGIHFFHEDWEVACDNTRTCRAAGYQSDQDEAAVSVLLTRKAGPNQPVSAELMLGYYGDESAVNKMPPSFRLSMHINGRGLGQVPIRQDTLVAALSPAQVSALLQALIHKSTIEWHAGENRWRLSDKGAAAVLLKMDEFQGRLGTKGALVRKGSMDESRVLPAVPAPVIVAAPVVKPRPTDAELIKRHSDALRKELYASVKGDDTCYLFEESEGQINVARLTDNKLLVSMECWRAAYNSGSAYWVIGDKPPFKPVLVTTSGTDDSDGTIRASHKGRGLGDCWSSEEWTWDGRRFVPTQASTTGMCKLVAAGGAWSLPTLVTDVRSPPK